MIVVAKRNIIIPGPGGQKFRMEKDYMGPVPQWAEDSAYLKALAADGKVILSASVVDRKSRKGKPPKEPKKEPPKETEAPEKEDA